MGLEKIRIEFIGDILEVIIKSLPLFSSYKLINKDIQKLSSPTKVSNYNFIFYSLSSHRELYVQIQDFFKFQKITFWIRNELDVKSNRLNLLNYFISELNNRSIKQKLVFKITTENDLEKSLKKIFEYLAICSDDKLKEVIRGKIWIDTPFDWGEYK